MRSRHSAISAKALILFAVVPALAGCSSGNPQEFQTSLRPREGVHPEATRRYPDGSSNYYSNNAYDRSYSQASRRYVDPGEPTPREIAAYDSGHINYGAPSNIQTASIGNTTYDQNARWQQPASGIATGPTAEYRPAYPAERPGTPHIVEVREGDTLYSLSRRYKVPLNQIVTANRLTSERIAIGQRLVIPTRYR